MSVSTEEMLNQFDSLQGDLNATKDQIETLIKKLLKGIVIHQITARVKTRDSLAKKIIRKNKYLSLFDIKDLLGFRIITYYADDVDKVIEIINEEFKVNRDNSVDKRKKEANEFGYKSYHFVVKLNEKRNKLSEYSISSKYEFEIQIRTLLQHQWAEVEHKFGYKSEEALPANIQREFLKISVYSEDLDQRYIELRNTVLKYREEIKSRLANEEDFDLSNDVMFNLIDSNADAKQVLKEAQDAGYIIMVDSFISFYTIERLYYLGIKTYNELTEKLHQYKGKIVPFIDCFLEPFEKKFGMHKDFLIFYLVYVILITEHNDKINNFSNRFGLDQDFKDRLERCKKLPCFVSASTLT